MKIKPLFTNVAIEIEKAPDKTKFGLILTSEQDKKLEQATVTALGDEVTVVKKGDKILFKGYSADTIVLDDKEVSFIKEEEILATL